MPRFNPPAYPFAWDGHTIDPQGFRFWLNAITEWAREVDPALDTHTSRLDLQERAPIINPETNPPTNREQNDMWWTNQNAGGPGVGVQSMLMRRIARLGTDHDQIVGGNFPHLSRSRLLADAAQSIGNNAVTTLLFPNDVSTGGTTSPSYNAGTITIPAGFGGMFQIDASCRWAANGTGNRLLFIQVLSGARAGQVTQFRQGGSVMENTLNNGNSTSGELALSGDATFDIRVVQNSGAALDLEEASVSIRMTQHRPDW